MPADNQALMAPNQLIQAPDGVTYAYRRFGDAGAGRLPLVMLQHFRGNLDDWDPLLLDTLAPDREVIPVDLAGVGLSTGTVPRGLAVTGRCPGCRRGRRRCRRTIGFRRRGAEG